jgi:hypothetical protein
MNLLDLIHQKLELFRLEQRYTRKRHRRSTFISEAVYVNGEYVYAPTSAYANKNHTGSSDSGEERESGSVRDIERGNGSAEGSEARSVEKESKGSRRLSRMGLGWPKGKEGKRADTRVSVKEIKWDSAPARPRREEDWKK